MAYLDGIDLDPGLFRDKAATEPPKPRGMLRSVGDTALSFGQGAVQGVRMLTDLAGADNAVSGGLRTVDSFLAELKSPQAQADQAEQARILKEAEDAGVLDQVLAAGRAFLQAPVQTIAQGAGTIVPTVAATLLTGGAGAVARLAAPAIVGAAQGTGNVKGQVYDAVKRQYLEDGATPAEADARAAEAQAYAGPNADQLALGGALGALAGTTGAERALGMLKFGGKAPGVTARVARGAVTEAIPEAAQGAQEQVAQNVALQREGFDVPTARGVVSNATLEALAGAAIGGAVSIPRPREPVGAPALPVLAAKSVDEAIAAAQEAVAPKAEAKPDTGLAALRDTALAELGPLDRAEAVRLLAVAGNPKAGPGVRAFATARLQEMLSPAAGLPGAEVTEVDPADLIPTGETNELTSEQFDQMMLRRPTPSQRAAAAKGLLPVGEATELEPETIEDGGTIPVPDVIEDDGIRPEGMAPRTPRADAVAVDRTMPNAVAAYVDRMREVNTPAARAFVQDFDAGRITPAEVADLIVPPRREPTADERLAAAAAQAPKAEPGDLLTTDNMPYGSRIAALARARKEGLTPDSVIEIPNAGYVVRPKEPRSVNQPDMAAPAGVAAGAPAGRAPDAGRGGMDVGRVADGARGPAPAAAGPARDSAEAAPAGGAGQPDPALTPASLAATASDDLPTLRRKWAEAARAGRTEEAAALNDRIVALKAEQGQASAPAPAPTPAAPAPAPAAPQEAAPELVKVMTVFGTNTYVRRADMEGDPNGLIRQFTKDGKNNGRLARGNLDPTGEQRKAAAAESAANPLFNVITRKGGFAFANETAAQRELNARGLSETHEVAPAATVRPGAGGFIVRRKQAATLPAKEGPTTQGATDGQELQGQGQGRRREALTPEGAAVPSGSSAVVPPSSALATDPVRQLGKVMQRAGWEIDYIDLDLTSETPKAEIKLKRNDGRLIFARLDAQGRGTVERFQRAVNLRMDKNDPQSRLAPRVDDEFLGRDRYQGGRAMLRGLTQYLTDNALNPVALEDMRKAWAGVMAGPVQTDAGALPAPSASTAVVPAEPEAQTATQPAAQPEPATARPSEAVIALKKRIVILTKLRSCLG